MVVEVSESVLSVQGLVVEFDTEDGIVHAVDHVSYDVHAAETVGVVGESGSGKSVSVMSMLGLIPQPPGRIVGGRVLFEGKNLLSLSESELRVLRGRDLAVVFQDPMTSLNPVLTVGEQIAEALMAHDRGVEKAGARERSVELLTMVGVPDANGRFDQFPHEYSGGMRQRAMIAMAIANGPKVLIADEPTTALDVTIQAQVLDVLRAAQRETDAATILITHDLGLIAEMADRVVVMYAGRVVETGSVVDIFHAPRHPYTLGLLSSLPRLDTDSKRLLPIPGQPPSLVNVPSGCAFHPRCRLSNGRQRCVDESPALLPVEGDDADDHRSACHFADEMRQETTEVAREAGLGGMEEAT
jgi:oligopeptide/dipeptide ABC transporter ATP-binding protein